MKTVFREELTRSGRDSLLVRYPNWVGDAVLALPALGALRRSLPGFQISVLARPWVADVVSLSRLADEVLPVPPRGMAATFFFARSLRGRGFGGAVLLQNAFGAALLALLSRIPLRGGYDTDGRGLLLTHPVPRPREERVHQVHYYLDAVRALGFTAEVDPVPRLAPPGWEGRKGPFAVLAPGASFGPAKMWPWLRYAELGRILAARGLAVLVVGGPAESGICRQVAKGIGASAECLAGRTTLAEVSAMLAAASLVVCNDSGIMHLAAAVGAPLVALFGSTDPEATGPVSEKAVVLSGSAPCAPCFLRECPRRMECYDDLTVARVLAACETALGGKG